MAREKEEAAARGRGAARERRLGEEERALSLARARMKTDGRTKFVNESREKTSLRLVLIINRKADIAKSQ